MTTGMLDYFPSKPEFTSLVNVQSKQIADFNTFLNDNPSGLWALLLFVKQGDNRCKIYLVFVDFQRVHPEVDLSILLTPYEEAIADALSVPLPQAAIFSQC